MGRIGVGRSDLLDAQMQRAEIALENAGTSRYRSDSNDEPENGDAAALCRSRMEWICSSVGMLDAAMVS
jgi:hypothetical protein